jgi:hypothetical protein
MTWMAQKFEHWAGRDFGRQIVYFGSIQKTFIFSGLQDPTGLWVVVNGDENNALPIPTSPQTITAKATDLQIELRTTVANFGTTCTWNDLPEHDNPNPGLWPGGVTLNLQHTDQTIYSEKSERVFRFTSPANPTGCYVYDARGVSYPIPTYQAGIEVGSTHLGVKLVNLPPNVDEVKIFYQDVTPS